MTLSHLLSRALLFALGYVTVLGAADLGNPVLEAARPHGDRVDRAWKRYRNRDLGYCVSYPSRWAKGDAFNGSGLYVETGLHRYSKPTGEIDIGPLNGPGPADARIQPASLTTTGLEQNLQEHFAGLRKFARAERIEIVEQHPFTVRSYSALYAKSKYYDPLERRHWLEEVVFVARKGEVYRIELQCMPDQVSRFEPVFAYLVNTFEFDCAK